jgi:hypothetical protein
METWRPETDIRRDVLEPDTKTKTAGSNTQSAVLVVIEKKVEGRQQEQDQWDQSYIGYKRVMIWSCLN